MVRDLRSLSLSIMRKVEEIALRERQGEVQVEVPVEIAAFLLNEKRHSLVYFRTNLKCTCHYIASPALWKHQDKSSSIQTVLHHQAMNVQN